MAAPDTDSQHNTNNSADDANQCMRVSNALEAGTVRLHFISVVVD